jgi:hypothetical protein
MVMIALGALFAVVTLVYVLRMAFSRQTGEIGGWEIRGAARRIAAVARTTIAEGVRTKAALGFALLVLASVPLFWLIAEGDGTIKGKVQMFITYSLGFAGFVLSLLTILFSCRSLSNEIATRQIYGIVSKPVPRWQILTGKWVGVMSLNVILLGLVGLGTYVGTKAITWQFKGQLRHELTISGGLTPKQSDDAVAALDRVRGIGKAGMESPVITAMTQATGMSRKQIGDVLLKLPEPTRVNLRRFDELRRQVLVARASVHPPIPDLTEAIEKRYREMEQADTLPELMTPGEIREHIATELAGSVRTVPPGTGRVWKLKGPKPEERRDFIMSVRFKLRVAATIPALRNPDTGELLEEETVLCVWTVGDPRTANSLEHLDTQPANTYKELELPTNCIESDGTIVLTFLNIDPRNNDVIFDYPDGLEVLYRVGSFGINVFQACLATLVPLACLSSLGVCASSFLSFPVGSLIIGCLYLISISMGFVAESLAVSEEYAPDPTRRGLDWEVRRMTVNAIGTILSVGGLDPTNQLIDGRTIDWSVPWHSPLRESLSKWPFALLKSIVILMIGVLVFRRRELAAVIV